MNIDWLLALQLNWWILSPMIPESPTGPPFVSAENSYSNQANTTEYYQ